MPTYKTPGVYIEEILKFPPSVAAVETAIPAFIGFTEKDTDADGASLVNRPVRITSLLEFEQLFGVGQHSAIYGECGANAAETPPIRLPKQK